MNQKIVHKRSNVVTDGTAKLPTADQLDYGELAINYADGNETITIKNSNNDIVSFKSQEYIDDNELFTKDTTTASGIVRKNGGTSTATGTSAFAEGYNVTASGKYAHAEGLSTTASGQGSHTEGYGTKASAYYSHAEGLSTTASGQYSHAEGEHTTASEQDAHAEGVYTTASAKGSHAEGVYTEASGEGSHAEGCYNVPSKLSIHSVGIGTLESKTNAEDILRSNGYKYLIGLGNYDGTNLTVTSGETESVNSNIKSVQEILNKLIEEAGGLNVLFSPYQAVDLGLPSGLKWANMNVGATSESDAGLYFQWGDTVGYTIDQLSSTVTTEEGKKYFGWSDYKYSKDGDKDNPNLTKYCDSGQYGYNGFTDTFTTLVPSDDAATANMGNKWRMPTQTEFQELIDNTTNTWTKVNGDSGLKLTSKTNGNSIFIPAAGELFDGSKASVGSMCYCLSSSVETGGSINAFNLRGYQGGVWSNDKFYRYRGVTVRGVLKQ